MGEAQRQFRLHHGYLPGVITKLIAYIPPALAKAHRTLGDVIRFQAVAAVGA